MQIQEGVTKVLTGWYVGTRQCARSRQQQHILQEISTDCENIIKWNLM